MVSFNLVLRMVPRYLSRTSSATPLPPPPQTGQPWAQEGAQSGEEHGEKNEFEANHSFIKSESRITLYLKTTFSPVSLYKKSDENNRSDSAKERNPNPGFFRSSSLQKGFAGTLVRGSESQVQLGLASSWTWVLTKWDWF